MKKRVKDISSSSKKKSNSKDVYSSSKISKRKGRIGFFKKPTSPKGVFALIGKIMVCGFLLCVIGLSIVITGMTVYVMKATDTQSGINLEKESVMKSGVTTIYGKDSGGNDVALSSIATGTTRLWCDIDKIPAHVKNAFVAIEDNKFYQHDGVDFQRTFVAFLNMFLHFWSAQGGSTITQQLVKNVTGDRDVGGIEGIKRKTREIYRAISLEKTYSKDQILQAYLNIIPIGGRNGDYAGIQTAARLYYNKDIWNVTLAEAASLAVITKKPISYDPIHNPDNNKERRDKTLRKMLELKMISQKEYDEAVNTPVKANPGRVIDNNGKSYQSYFVDATLNQVVSDYMKKYNIDSWDEANSRVKSAGFNIYTTIDIDMQEKLEQMYENPSTFGWKTFDNKPQSAFVIFDLNGNMKACVGATGKKQAGDRTTNNYANLNRSPGSTMKPIAAYAPAIENNDLTYSSIVEDSPIRKVDGNDWPQNYDRKYNGKITAAFALEKSLNTIPTKLVEKMGVKSVYDFLSQKLKLTGLVDPAHPLKDGSCESSGIAMGALTKGIKLSELANAYQIFGNGGQFTKATTYTEVVDAAGEVSLKSDRNSEKVISSDTAAVMNRMLRNVIQNGTGKAASLDGMGIEVVGKTGMSNDNKNLTFIGLTHDYVAGVWIGNVDGKELPMQTINQPSKIFYTVMSKIFKGKKQKNFEYAAAKEAMYCADTGLIANDSCPRKAKGYYRLNNMKNRCSMHG